MDDIFISSEINKEENDFLNILNSWKEKNNIDNNCNNNFNNNLLDELSNIEKKFHLSYLEFRKKIKKRKIIYTAIIGDYDYLQDPKIINDDWDYLCFTDNASRLTSIIWKIIDIRYYEELQNITNKVLLARTIKWSPVFLFENIDFSIWVDANIIINTDLNIFLNKLPQNVGLILSRHPNRNCIYQEIIAIKSRIDRGIIRENLKGVNQWCLDLKFNLKYPEGIGLCQTGLKIHNHQFKDNLINIEKSILHIMKKYEIIRDQLIFNFICYYLKIKYYVLESLPSISNKQREKYEFYLNNHKK